MNGAVFLSRFKSDLPVVLPVGVGAALFLFSFAWAAVVPPAAYWSESREARLVEVDSQAASLRKKIAEANLRGAEIKSNPPTLVSLEAEREALLAARIDAHRAPQRDATRIRYAAAVIMAAGIAAHLLRKRRTKAEP